MSNNTTPWSDQAQRPGSSLGARLVALVVVPVLLVAAGSAWFTLRTASGAWRDVVEQCGQRMSTNILAATHLGMLHNQKSDVETTLARLARDPDVDHVRIFDKEGAIAFSSEPAEVGRRMDLHAEACAGCHAEAGQAVPEHRSRIFRAPDGERILGITTSIPNEPVCATADCHAHPDVDSALGVLDVRLSLARADASLGRIRTGVAVVSLLLALSLAVVTVLVVHRLVQVPVQELISGTRRIAGGDLDHRVQAPGRGELSILASAFNRMTDDLARAREENEEWARTLEAKVQEKTAELERTREHMVQVEKLASLGKLSATVAHELNNPLSGILTYAKLTRRVLRDQEETLARDLDPEDVEGMHRWLEVIERESGRCGEIVKNLLLFSRASELQMGEHALGEIVDRATMLVGHHLEMTGVELERCIDGGEIRLFCDANQVQQALVALLINAVEAMPSGGRITITCAEEGDEVLIEVRDTGYGIPEHVLPHVFEPFYSTKEEKKGVGLGLAVVYGIARRHGGRIDVETEEGVGTAFRMYLPRRPAGGSEDDPGEAA